MIDFSLTEEQEMFRKTLREFAAGEIGPLAESSDRSGEYPRQLFRRMGELGYLGVPFPEQHGGSGQDAVTFAILAEELAKPSAGIALGVYVHVALALSAVAAFGSEEQRRRYLEPGIRGKKVGCWGFAEADAGSDPGGIRTRAVRDGDSYVVNGAKMFITNGTFADFVVATVSTAPEKGMKGLSLLIVDRDTPGFRAARRIEMLGVRAAETAELVFEDCRVPAANLLGAADTGFAAAMRTLTLGRIMAAAFAVGLATAAYEHALGHAKTRNAFGQPIGSFQGVAWMLADMNTSIEAARLLTLQAAWKAARGEPHILEASRAKLFSTEAASRVAGQALQIHGGTGYAMESPLQRFYRDCKLLEIGEGTSQIQRYTIARMLGLAIS
jgi:alkylation response protein AidB-like acyl-CoA dehydrogenase